MLSAYLRSDAAAPHLRIGLLLDGTTLPRCFVEVLDHILLSNFARLELLVFNAEVQQAPAVAPRRPLPARMARLLLDRQRRRSLLFGLYQRYDSRNAGVHDPHTPVDCTARLADVEAMSVTPSRQRFVQRFPAEAIERIRARQLDVLLRFGFNILRGEILAAARCGVWSYHHGDGDYYRGGPSCFWEVYEGNPLTGTMLQVLTEDLDAGVVLQKGVFATYPGLSRENNCLQPYWGAATFVIQKLHELHQHGWDWVKARAPAKSPYRGRRKLYTVPSNWEMTQWLVPQLWRKARRRLRRQQPLIEHWQLAIRTDRQLDVAAAGPADTSGFRIVESPRGRFYADPFLLDHDGQTWLFFEDCDYARGHGRISCAEVRNGELGPALTALERPYHLSYPCIFRAAGELYMVPESVASGTVDLYRCRRFPDQWELEKELLRESAVDTTVWVAGELFWFFVTLQEPRGFGTQLWLFSASDVAGAWQPHPLNPLSTDVRNARGAGAIFRRNGRLYRPSQNCGPHYGYSFTLNEILVCDRERYEERPVVTVTPEWAPHLVGTHSYAHSGNVEVIDGCSLLPAAGVLD
jgi:hypothetical protein